MEKWFSIIERVHVGGIILSKKKNDEKVIG